MERKFILFTDGSSLGNPGKGGYGAIIFNEINKEVLEIGGSENDTTNNRMELRAAIEGLLMTRRIAKEIKENFETIIHTDSAYVINGITKWIHGWEKNNWMTGQKESVMNQDLWQALIELTREAENRGGIKFEKVKGHSGVAGNERVDQIATSFAEKNPTHLFSGSISDYESSLKGSLSDIEPKNEKKSTKKNGKAYSYVSFVDGNVFVDKTWEECKERVHGAKGAKYKKALNEEEEKELIALWSLESLS